MLYTIAQVAVAAIARHVSFAQITCCTSYQDVYSYMKKYND